jgi:lysophospholipase L1-like esterase
VTRTRIAAVAPYILGGVLAGFLVLEGAARVLRLGPPLNLQYGASVPDAFIPYKRRPLSRVTGRTDEFDFDYQHNSLGFRDTEHTIEKPPAVFRIVALGDSFTYGVGAAFEDTYLVQLERLLNEHRSRTTPVEVIKLGMPRYFPEPERLVLEHYGLQFKPDLVMVAILPNDIVDSYLGLEAIGPAPEGFLLSRQARRLGETGTWLSMHSRVMRILLGRWAAFVSERERPVHWADVYKDGGFHERDWRAVESELERMQELTRQHDAHFVVVSIPQHGPWNDERTYPERRLARWSAAHGAVLVPTLAAVRAASAQQVLYWQKDGHCNRAGYTVIAQAIVAELVRQELVP